MKKYKLLTLENVKIGQKVKLSIPRSWAQVPISKPHAKGPYCWVKGIIVSKKGDFITINTRYKWHKRKIHSFLNNLGTSANKEGIFNNIYLQFK